MDTRGGLPKECPIQPPMLTRTTRRVILYNMRAEGGRVHRTEILKGLTRSGDSRWYWICSCHAMSDMTWDVDTQAWRAAEKHQRREFEKAGR
jgi:hypothetical protein